MLYNIIMRCGNKEQDEMEKLPKHQIYSNIKNKKIPGLKIMGDLNKAYIVNYKQKVSTTICKHISTNSKKEFVFFREDNQTRIHKTLKLIKYTLEQINKEDLKSGDLYFGFSEYDIIWYCRYWKLNINTFVEEHIKESRWLDLLIYIGDDYSLTANSCAFNRVTPNENKYFIRINVKK